MEVNPDFTYYHQYRKLTRRGVIKEPLLHRCGAVPIGMYAADDSFNLYCPACDETIIPGASTLDDIRITVEKHLGENNGS